MVHVNDEAGRKPGWPAFAAFLALLCGVWGFLVVHTGLSLLCIVLLCCLAKRYQRTHRDDQIHWEGPL